MARRHAPVASIVVVSLLYYLLNREWAQPASDTVALTYMPFAILEKHTFFLNSFGQLVGTLQFHGHEVSKSPIGTPLTVLLGYVPYVLIDGHVTPAIVAGLGKLSATLLTTAGNALVYRALLVLGVRRSLAIAGALLLAIGTEQASIASQGMWQQSGETFWLVLLLLCAAYIWRGSRSSAPYIAIGFSSGMVVLCRLQDVVIAAPILVAAAVHVHRSNGGRRRQLSLVGAGLIPCAAFQLAYNLVVFHSVVATGYANDNGSTLASFDNPLLPGLNGVLLSPSKGWLVYTPWFLIAVGAAASCCWRTIVRRSRYHAAGLMAALTLLLLPYILMMAKYFRWPGGYSFGPRYETDVDAVVVVLLMWALNALLQRDPPLLRGGPVRANKGKRFDLTSRAIWSRWHTKPVAVKPRWVMALALVVLGTWSAFTQYLGTYVAYGFQWNHVATTASLYSWTDSQLAFYMRAFASSFDGRLPRPLESQIAVREAYFTSATNPLGNSDANAARVTCFAANETYWGFVTVDNAGPDVLRAFPNTAGIGNFLVSYHLYRGNQPIQYDGETANLMLNLQPGHSTKVEVLITTPEQPGWYNYVFTGVQEGVKWFQDGNGTMNAEDVQIRVRGSC